MRGLIRSKGIFDFSVSGREIIVNFVKTTANRTISNKPDVPGNGVGGCVYKHDFIPSYPPWLERLHQRRLEHHPQLGLHRLLQRC